MKEGVVDLEVHVSLHIALGQLCPMRKVYLKGARVGGGGGGEMNYTNADGGMGVTSSRLKNYNGSTSLNLCINQKLSFPIEVKDLPRASRVLFRLWGWRKKKKGGSGVDANSTNAVFLGWVACTVFDFKGDDDDDDDSDDDVPYVMKVQCTHASISLSFYLSLCLLHGV